MRRLKKNGEKMVSEDGPRELVRRLNNDGEDGLRVPRQALYPS